MVYCIRLGKALEGTMSELQTDIERIIKNHINQLTGLRQQKKSLHISHQYHDLLGELYNTDTDGIAFLNHFGHLEYHNVAFSKFLMLDKYDKSFNNIYNLDQLPLTITTDGERIQITYPNNVKRSYVYAFKIVNFQKSILLQLSFKDTSKYSDLADAFAFYKTRYSHYMKHLKNPMFLIDAEGLIVHMPDNNLELFGRAINKHHNESIFEALPFDYANEIIEKVKSVTSKLDGHFLHQIEYDKIITVYDTTVHKINDNLFLCTVVDVSDLNTMSSTLEYLNAYDSLTGFYNTSYYDNLINNFNDSGHLPIGVYTITLQGLKQVNLKLGHHQCDNLLIDVALCIKSAISQHEIPCRISGDTFIVFFPNCSNKTLEKFIKTMEQHVLAFRRKYHDYHITYAQKNIHISDHQADLKAIIKGLLI